MIRYQEITAFVKLSVNTRLVGEDEKIYNSQEENILHFQLKKEGEYILSH
jgi:hypothetical protein